MGQRRLGRSLVFEPVIDLVGDKPEAMPPAGLGDLGKAAAECHGTGRVIRACGARLPRPSRSRLQPGSAVARLSLLSPDPDGSERSPNADRDIRPRALDVADVERLAGEGAAGLLLSPSVAPLIPS